MKLVSGSGHNNRNSRAAQPEQIYFEAHEPARRPQSAQPSRPQMQQPAKPPKKKKGKGWLIALIVVLALAALAYGYWKLTTKPPENDAPAADDQTPSYDVERYYTLLVVGDDQQGGNTDTIMLMRFDTQEMAVNIVSIPRDTLVNSTLNNKKINAIYHNLDGITSLMDEVEDITGFRPNNYVVVNTNVFVEVVDALGGVDFYVPFDMHYDDGTDQNDDGIIDYEFHIHVTEGQQTLSGYDAMGVFRWRQNNNGEGHVYGNPDIERIEMQHNLLLAIAQKAMSTRNVATLVNIASAVLPECKTDLSVGNIQWYATQFLQMSMDNLNFFTMPTTGTMIKKGSYVTINVDEWIDMVNQNFNPYGTTITKEDCGIVYYTQTPSLVGGQYHMDPAYFAVTNGEEMESKWY